MVVRCCRTCSHYERKEYGYEHCDSRHSGYCDDDTQLENDCYDYDEADNATSIDITL